MHSPLVENILKHIEQFEPSKATSEKVGRVTSVSDGVVSIEGLSDALMSEVVHFDTSEGLQLETAMDSHIVRGLILNLEEGGVKAIVLGDSSKIREGMLVRSSGSVLSIPVSDSIVGRVVDALGTPVDGKGAVSNAIAMPLEREAYGVIDRQSVNEPLHTGIKAIDAMIPIGRGQRELIIGDRFTGKTTVAIDTILNQLNESKEKRPICIYVAIGQKQSKTARIVEELREKGALEYTIIVDAPASAPAALQFLAPFAGAAIGEYFMQKGMDALVIYDDLTKQAIAYRELSLLLRRPPGREAFPGDIFYLHSRLLERAAKLSDAKGGGSLTALPIIETQQGDVSAYIPTNVISITDGQIFLDASLFNKGVRPAIDVGISVSRVGSSAQTKAMKGVSGSMKLTLAQFRELEAFVQFAQDLDATTAGRIDNGRRMVEILKQVNGKPMPFEEQVFIIYAATEGLLSNAVISKLTSVEAFILELARSQHADVLAIIRTERALSDASKAAIKDIVRTASQLNNTLFVENT
jgi:F-type H+/Na+-transporting ATPase subunit alpha